MSKDKVSLTLPEVQLVAEVDCDEVECSIEILDHTFRSFNLFDVQNRKFSSRSMHKLRSVSILEVVKKV